MKVAELEEFLIHEEALVSDALKIIDTNAQGICFVINKNKVLVGILTDGDIRRAFLKQSSIKLPVREVMNKQFVALSVKEDSTRVQAHLNEKIRHIPLLDEFGIPVDYASLFRLKRHPIMEPSLNGNELVYVSECINSNWISSQGRFVTKFEEQVANYCGMPYALAVSNGTVALQLALTAMGIGRGDEVIVPNLTFAASINSIIHAGATPILIDVNLESKNLLVDKIEELISVKTKAIMPVHLYGYPCEMDAINEIAKKNDLLVLEDAAEAFGSKYKGRMTGALGDAATFSFFGNKTITTGEGGMLLFKESKYFERAKLLRDHGMSVEVKYWHEEVGFNFRMTNLQAAIGVAQMERIKEIIDKKISIGEWYRESLNENPLLTLPKVSEEHFSTNWLYTVLLEESLNRDDVMRKLALNGIETRPVFVPLNKMPPYKNLSNMEFPNSEKISRQGMSLPSSLSLSQREVQSISKTLSSITNAHDLRVKIKF